MREKGREALNFIRSHPALEMSLFQERFLAFWAGVDSPLRAFLRAGSWGDRILLVANFLIAMGTLGGLAAVWLNWRRFAFVLSTFPVVFPALYYVTEPYLRYRQPIDPILILLTVLALDSVLRRRDHASGQTPA